MNDINLVKSGTGYDWEFSVNNVSDVIGDQQLISAIIHNVLLNQYELEQEFYQGKGGNLAKYVGLPANNINKELVKSEVENMCRMIDGVFDAVASVEILDESIQINHISVTKDNGGVFEIGI